MRVISKSAFKLGLECPNKLYYKFNEKYTNQKKEDPFLQSLAHGGFQVEELARLHYPGGVMIHRDKKTYQELWDETREFLAQDNVTIYQAAFLFEGLFIHADILKKEGTRIDLIEVKAKSFDSTQESPFLTKKGALNSSWKPYLFDIAFQKYVTSKCMPGYLVSAYLMMADKSKNATVDGLNQMFRVKTGGDKQSDVICKVTHVEECGESILGLINTDTIVDDIISGKHLYYENLSFTDALTLFRENAKINESCNWPVSYSTCRKCEFKSTPEEEKDGLKSGFKHCFSTQLGWDDADFNKANTFEVWNFRKGKNLFEEGKVFLSDLDKNDIGFTQEENSLTNSHRQWLQIEKSVNRDTSVFLKQDGLLNEMHSWKYPYHFIDFETSAVALPFTKERRPYEQVAFQFSHHILTEDGQVIHNNQFLSAEPGVFPNFEFIRHLKTAVEQDEGTIFRYATHENTIINAIYRQLHVSREPDKEILMAFIKEIAKAGPEGDNTELSTRPMVDLCAVVKKYYFNPLTNGSNSLKMVLPAIINSGQFIQHKYSQPISQIRTTSLNLDGSHIWLKQTDDVYENPYKSLAPVFDDWSDEEKMEIISELDEIQEGGAAMTAYSKLQYVDMTEKERKELESGLLKYCELDTLAMVMLVEHFLNDLGIKKSMKS